MNGNENRIKIIDEGIRCFLQKGYHGSALSDIMKTLNISKAAFYYYFKSKQDLLDTIIDQFDSQFLDKIITEVENCDSHFLTKFKLSHKLTTNFAFDNKDLCLVIVTLTAELAGTGEPIGEKLTSVYQKFVNFYARLIEFGKQEGAIDANVDSNAMANIIAGNHHGVLLGWHVSLSSGNSFDSKAAAKLYLNVLMLGLLKRIM